jgi:hypothetical protein
MVWSSPERLLPIPRLPEPEPLHLRPTVSHRSVPVHPIMQVHVYQLLHVGTDDLVRIDKDDLVEIEREEYIEEEDLVPAKNFEVSA